MTLALKEDLRVARQATYEDKYTEVLPDDLAVELAALRAKLENPRTGLLVLVGQNTSPEDVCRFIELNSLVGDKNLMPMCPEDAAKYAELSVERGCRGKRPPKWLLNALNELRERYVREELRVEHMYSALEGLLDPEDLADLQSESAGDVDLVFNNLETFLSCGYGPERAEQIRTTFYDAIGDYK